MTNEDLLLLKYLFETDFLTRYEIKKYIYPALTKTTIDRRKLYDFCKEGLLIRYRNPLHSMPKSQIYDLTFGRYVYMATDKALDLMFTFDSWIQNLVRIETTKLQYFVPDCYYVQKKMDLRNIEHDCLLNICRFEFENLGAEYWITQKMINRLNLYKTDQRKVIPDGVFKKNGKTFAVELENTLKKTKSYEEILNTYCQVEGIDFILYVCTSDMILNSMLNKLNSSFITYSPDSWKKFYVIHLDSLLKGNLVINNPGTVFNLNMLWGNNN